MTGESVGSGELVGAGCVFPFVGCSVAIGVAVCTGKGVLLGSPVSVGEDVMVTGVTLGTSQAVGVPLGVLVSLGAAISVRPTVGLGVGVISAPSSSLSNWNRSRRISSKTTIAIMARFITSYFTPSRSLRRHPSHFHGEGPGMGSFPFQRFPF